MKLNRLFLLITVLLIVAGLAACAQIPGQADPTTEPIPEEAFDPVITVTGIVVPSRKSTLSARASSVIEELLISVNDPVEAGQPLLRLQGNESLEASIAAAKLELVLAQQALDNLDKNRELSIATAQQEMVAAEQSVDSSQRKLNNLNTRSKNYDIQQAQANLILAGERLEKARKAYKPYENKSDDNLVRATLLSRLAQAERDYDALVRLLNNLTGMANSLDVKEAEAALSLAQARLTTSTEDYQMLLQGPDPDDVAAAKARLENAQAQLKAAETMLDDLVLTAPYDGVVSEVYVNPGEWLTIGQPVMLLADLNNLIIETTDLSEIDVAQVHPGDQAMVTFDAFSDFTTIGTVTRISPKSTQGSGVNYTVTLQMNEIPQNLRWGMTAFVDIRPEQ